MHAFSKDGKHLVIHDGFGLSRISFPKSVKTDKSLAGRDLSLAANRLLVSASKSNQRALRSVDALLNLRFSGSNYDAYALYPDDQHAVQPAFRTLRVIDTSAKGVVETLEFAADMPIVQGIDLGRTRPTKNNFTTVARMGEDGTIATFGARGQEPGEINVGRMKSATTLEPMFRVLHDQPAGQLLLYPSADETFIGAYDRGLAKARIYRVDAKRDVQFWELDARSTPTFSGGYWCWQRDEATLCRADWRELDKPERFAIPQEHAGIGTVMAHGDKLLLLTADRERVVDVQRAKVIDRKLAAKELPIRERAMTVVRRYDRWLGEEAGELWFGHLDHHPKTGRTSWSPQFDLGAHTLSAHFAFGDLVNTAREGAALSISSYSLPSGVARCDLEAVRRAFSALERHEGQLLRALTGMHHALKSHFEPAYDQRNKRGLAAPAKMFTTQAATVLLRAVFAVIQKRGKVPLVHNVDVWSKQAFTARELAAQRFVADSWNATDELAGAFELSLSCMFIAIELLGAEALDAVLEWTVRAPTDFATANAHIAVEAVAALIRYFPETEERYRAESAKSTQGADMLRSLEFSLGR